MKSSLFLLITSLSLTTVFAQVEKPIYTKQDTLMGTNTPDRAWWNVQRYHVSVMPDYESKTISGSCEIIYKEENKSQSARTLRFDLQEPLIVDSVHANNLTQTTDGIVGRMGRWRRVDFKKDGPFYYVVVDGAWAEKAAIKVFYHGKPKEAVNPPWDGGWVWAKDKQGRPWMSVACQGDGASLWYPCKDYWADEPDEGASLTVTIPDNLVAVGNGRLKNQIASNGKKTFTWEVTNPINAYNIIPYIGHYVSWTDTLAGEKGKLDLTHWVLDYELPKAKKQFSQVKPTLHALEHWFGPYPFYEDGYQLVQSPYLGMEHQSAVAYGNEFTNGYLGNDLSRTGWGLKWDYIIVHETGHEWFGNNITAKDRADMWIQEGFTDYSETLFTEYYYGKLAGDEYTQGLRVNIENREPIIANYGVNKEGSGDMYFKGSNLIHTIRQIINDDDKFRSILRGLNKDFYHQTITSRQLENYISLKSGKDLSKIFDQYLRTVNLPTLEYKQNGNTVQYRWKNTVSNFSMPVRLSHGIWINPSATWKTIKLPGGQKFEVNKNFYINVKKS